MKPQTAGENLIFDFWGEAVAQEPAQDSRTAVGANGSNLQPATTDQEQQVANDSNAQRTRAQQSPAIGTQAEQLGARGREGEQQGLSGSNAQPTQRTVRKKQRAYGKQGFPQPYLTGGVDPVETYFDIDPPKRRNAGYRVRRDLRQEQLIDMPLVITAIELRAGVAEDDRAWNRKFNGLREEFVKEISYLKLVLGEKLRVELTWQLPLNWPLCALRAPDGTRIVQTDSQVLWGYGVRSATMLWKSVLDKQQEMQAMARNYEALLRWAGKVGSKVGEAMDGTRSSRLLLDPEIHKQINSLEWPKYHRDTSGGPFSPLPFNVAESMRVRHWAYAKAVKQHVHAMNLNYNRVTNEQRVNLGKARRAALAVGICDGACRMPLHYWALWVRKGTVNLFYRTVTPRVVSSSLGKYATSESFPVADDRGRLRTGAINRCHLSHMAEIYCAADLVLHQLLVLSDKTAALIVQTMGKRHGSDSPAATGRGQWRGSGKFFRWFPGQ